MGCGGDQGLVTDVGLTRCLGVAAGALPPGVLVRQGLCRVKRAYSRHELETACVNRHVQQSFLLVRCACIGCVRRSATPQLLTLEHNTATEPHRRSTRSLTDNERQAVPGAVV